MSGACEGLAPGRAPTNSPFALINACMAGVRHHVSMYGTQVILFYSITFVILLDVTDEVALQGVADQTSERVYRTVFYAQVGPPTIISSGGGVGGETAGSGNHRPLDFLRPTVRPRCWLTVVNCDNLLGLPAMNHVSASLL